MHLVLQIRSPCTKMREIFSLRVGLKLDSICHNSKQDYYCKFYAFLIKNPYRNALRSVKVGGCVVYSTCTLAPNQNDVIVDNAASLAESRYGIKVVERSLIPMQKKLSSSGLFKFSHLCHRGILILPFLPSNFGPMYVCKLQRVK